MTKFYTYAHVRKRKIYVRGIQNGERFSEIIDDYSPYLFLPDPKGDYKTVKGKPCKKVNYPSIPEAFSARKAYRENKLEFYGMDKWVYQYINDNYPNGFKYDAKYISIVSLDIEVAARNGFPDVDKAEDEITAITLVKDHISYTFSYKDYVPQNNKQIYFKCRDEVHLLKEFLAVYRSLDPDIITGWSIERFDIPYLIHRMDNVLGFRASSKLSPWGFLETKEIIRGKTTNASKLEQRVDIIYLIDGVSILDYIELYKKFSGKNHESYALKFIAQYVLGRTKVEYKGTLDELYDNDFQKFIEYNIEDALLVHDMELKLDYINRVIDLAYIAKVNYMDTLKNTRMWDVIIHNWLFERKMVIPQQTNKDERPLKGAYVKYTEPRMYRWVVGFDYDSLYPSMISQHNLSPETILGKVDLPTPAKMVQNNQWPEIKDDIIYAANGATFRKDIRGFIPTIVDEFLERRKTVRKKMRELQENGGSEDEIKILDGLQYTIKILNNSLYGAVAMKKFRWFNINIAEAITFTAQTCTRYMIKSIDSYLNKIMKTKGVEYAIASDTDSVYVELDVVVNTRWPKGLPAKSVVVEFLDKFCKEVLEPFVASVCKDLNEKFNAYVPKLNMKREVISDRAIWRAKKMYIMNIWQEDHIRFSEPKLKIKGIEVVRSNTPQICKGKIQKSIFMILNQEEKDLQKFIKEFKEEYFKLPFETIATPTSVNGIVTYYDKETLYKKGTPIHVKAALVYNDAIKRMGLGKKYKLIRDKDKIKYSYLRQPNIFHADTIASHDELPSEFELDAYIDRNKQWEKKFINPIESLTSIIGWTVEPVSSLEDFLPGD